MKRRISKTDLAWVAGFFDGEGYTHCQIIKASHNLKQMKMSITQKYPGLLFKVKRILGVGTVKGPYLYKNKKGSWKFEWTIQKQKEVERVFKLLKPHLGPLKIEQFEKAMATYNFVFVALP